MKHYPKDVPIQKMGCEILTYLSIQSVVDKASIDEAIPLVLAAFSNHPCQELVQEWGCRYLVCLTRQSKDAAKVVAKSNGVDLILKAMQTFRKQLNLQIHAIALLYNLASVAVVRKEIVNKDGISLVKLAMAMHRSNEAI